MSNWLTEILSRRYLAIIQHNTSGRQGKREVCIHNAIKLGLMKRPSRELTFFLLINKYWTNKFIPSYFNSVATTDISIITESLQSYPQHAIHGVISLPCLSQPSLLDNFTIRAKHELQPPSSSCRLLSSPRSNVRGCSLFYFEGNHLWWSGTNSKDMLNQLLEVNTF